MDKAGLIFIIPPQFDIEADQNLINAAIHASQDFHLACLRLKSGDIGRGSLIKRADTLREIGHSNEISVIIDDHYSLAREIGLDGVHLSTADPKKMREARKLLGPDSIFGVYAGASRHDGMTIGEIGCDYVSFGPIESQGLDIESANAELFEWWSEMIEIPVVAEGHISAQNITPIKDHTDFVAIGDEYFLSEAPDKSLRDILGSL